MSKKSKSTKQKIFDSATQLFLERGVDRVSVRDIASKAGVNLSLMNYYYHSKENLFEIIFESLVKEKAEHLRDILDKEIPIVDKLKEYVENYIDILIDEPILVPFVMAIIHRNPEKVKGMEAMKTLYSSEKFCAQVDAEAKAGRIKPVNAEQLYISIISLIILPFAIKDLISDRHRFSPEEFEKFIIERKEHITNLVIDCLVVK